ncbi:MAG: hypothetical protein WCL42_10000 [Chlorobiaceae bacterium]
MIFSDVFVLCGTIASLLDSNHRVTNSTVSTTRSTISVVNVEGDA